MSIEIRPPGISEWRACRMLLPESFRSDSTPEAFLAWDASRGAIAGLSVFHRHLRDTIRLQGIVVRPYRRQGIGSALLRRVCARAAERGDQRVWCRADLEKLPEAAPFLAAHGFAPAPALLRIEGELEPVRQTVLGVRDKLVAAGRIPPGARTVRRSQCRPEYLVKQYQEMLAPAIGAEAELADWAVSRPEFDALVLVVGDRPAGMLVGSLTDGRGMAFLSGLAVVEEHRCGWGWANAMLLAGAMDLAWAAGARRLQFETVETNWPILRHVPRVSGVVISRLVRFRRELGSG